MLLFEDVFALRIEIRVLILRQTDRRPGLSCVTLVFVSIAPSGDNWVLLKLVGILWKRGSPSAFGGNIAKDSEQAQSSWQND